MSLYHSKTDHTGIKRYPTFSIQWKGYIYKGYTRVYRVYSTTRVNMGAQDISGYKGYTVLLRVNIGTEDK